MILMLLLVAVALPAVGALRTDEAIRIAIVKGVSSLQIQGDGLLAVDEAGMPVRYVMPLTLQRSERGISVNGREVRSLRLASPEFIQVNGKRYRNILDIMPVEQGLLVINELPLEEYLVGLINAEISSHWPIEAVKAQAVIARSFALFQKNARAGQLYHLESTVLDQVYDGSDMEDSRSLRGVTETRGEVLTFAGSIIQAFYHSSCGGSTETPDNVWGFPLSYLKSVPCRYCIETPTTAWEISLPRKKLETLLKIPLLKELRIAERTEQGRVKTVDLVGTRDVTHLSGPKFRQAVGYGVIKSTNFTVKLNGDDYLFTGVGSGHGVGLCQWGAKERASEGFSYREILGYYYPGARISNWTSP